MSDNVATKGHWTTSNTTLEYGAERDRQYISLESGDATIGEWWDADVEQMFEDGFFDSKALVMGKLVNPHQLHASVVDYANSVGLGRMLYAD